MHSCVPRQPPDAMERGSGSECRNFVLDELREGEPGPRLVIQTVSVFSGKNGSVLRHV